MPEAGHDFAGRSSSRPSSVSTSVQAARELAELRGRMLEMEQEHEREKTQHRLELEKAEYALKVAQAANSSALAAESRVDSAAKDNDQELELKKLREQLASAEEKLAAAAAGEFSPTTAPDVRTSHGSLTHHVAFLSSSPACKALRGYTGAIAHPLR